LQRFRNNNNNNKQTNSKMTILGVVVALCMLHTALACQNDGDCGTAGQAGRCQAGVCECGAGFSGSTPVDPATCSLTCTPPAVPDAVVFLVEPNVTVSAAAGNLVLAIELDPYLKQTPTTVAFLHPGSGARCDMLPLALGTGRWSQAVDNADGNCKTDLVYSRAFNAEVAQSCWQTLPSVTESGAQYTINFKQYATQVEVIQSGLAPFGQAATRQLAETTITREFRRNYTISVATTFTPSSAPFQVIAGGALLYRLVAINYDVLNSRIIVTVQTQTAATAKVTNVAINFTASTGLTATVLAGPTTGTACDAASPAGKCDQYHVITFSDTPCAVSGASMTLQAVFVCADGSNASTCGYTNLPANNTYSMPNLLLNYDSCPRIVAYGVDTAASSLLLHTDVQRTTPVSAPALQGSTLYGRCSVFPTTGAVFQSVTMSALNIVELASPTNVDRGNQLSATFLTLISAATSTDPSNPQWDFNLVVDANFFALTKQYFLVATLDLTFANTGALTKRLIMIPLSSIVAMRGAPAALSLRQQYLGSSSSSQNEVVELVAVSGRATTLRNGGQQSVESPLFGSAAVRAGTEVATTAAASSSSSSSTMVIGIAAGIAGVLVVAGFIVVAVVARRRRRRAANEEHNRLPEMAVNSGDSGIDIL